MDNFKLNDHIAEMNELEENIEQILEIANKKIAIIKNKELGLRDDIKDMASSFGSGLISEKKYATDIDDKNISLKQNAEILGSLQKRAEYLQSIHEIVVRYILLLIDEQMSSNKLADLIMKTTTEEKRYCEIIANKSVVSDKFERAIGRDKKGREKCNIKIMFKSTCSICKLVQIPEPNGYCINIECSGRIA